MWSKNWVVVLAFVAALVSAQEDLEEDLEGGPNAQEVKGIRKLRLRRPRPKIISIDNEEGIAQGNPVPLRAVAARPQSTADLLAAAVQEPQSNALQSLLATAEGSGVSEGSFEPEQQPILPLRQQPVEPVRQAVEQPRREPAGRRRVPGVPRRTQGRANRPSPRAQAARAESDEEGGNGRPRPKPIQTTERYSQKNEDGSFTFGYVSEDGSFREETRGLDCITRGKYGYIDPDGKRREFTYVSGLPCDNDAPEFDDQGFPIEDDEVREDPIDPADRFRTENAVQLTDAEIPDSARRQPQRRPAPQPQRRPAPQPERRPQQQPRPVQTFNNFQAQQPARQQTRPRARPTAAAPRPTLSGNALQNLLNIADGSAAPPQASPTPVVTRPRPTPSRARPTAASPRPNFDFDSEVDSFALNRPALTFQAGQERPRTQNGAPAPANQAVGPNFSSELVFDAASGTFKTELRQTIAGGADINISDAAQPGARPQPTRQPTAAPRPTPTAFAATTRRPTPTGNPSVFQPLNFPAPSASPSPSSPFPNPSTPAFRPPTPTRPFISATTPRAPTPTAARPVNPASPANSFFFQPFPTVGAPRPVAPGQSATSIRPPTNGARVPAGTFNLVAGAPFPGQLQRPIIPQAFPGQLQRPIIPQAPRAPQPPQVPGFPRPTPVTQPRPAAAPTATAARLPAAPTAGQPQPQLQFGFSPIQQQQQPRPVGSVQNVARPQQPARPQGNAPFTAFRNGLPQQLQGVPQQFRGVPQQFQGVPQQFRGQARPQFQQPFQPRPGQPGSFTAFAPRPQQPQARPPQGFAVRPPPQQGLQQQRPEQFRTAGGPPARFQGRPAAPPAGFSVFNPASLRGARF